MKKRPGMAHLKKYWPFIEHSALNVGGNVKFYFFRFDAAGRSCKKNEERDSDEETICSDTENPEDIDGVNESGHNVTLQNSDGESDDDVNDTEDIADAKADADTVDVKSKNDANEGVADAKADAVTLDVKSSKGNDRGVVDTTAMDVKINNDIIDAVGDIESKSDVYVKDVFDVDKVVKNEADVERGNGISNGDDSEEVSNEVQVCDETNVKGHVDKSSSVEEVISAQKLDEHVQCAKVDQDESTTMHYEEPELACKIPDPEVEDQPAPMAQCQAEQSKEQTQSDQSEEIRPEDSSASSEPEPLNEDRSGHAVEQQNQFDQTPAPEDAQDPPCPVTDDDIVPNPGDLRDSNLMPEESITTSEIDSDDLTTYQEETDDQPVNEPILEAGTNLEELEQAENELSVDDAGLINQEEAIQTPIPMLNLATPSSGPGEQDIELETSNNVEGEEIEIPSLEEAIQTPIHMLDPSGAEEQGIELETCSNVEGEEIEKPSPENIVQVCTLPSK